jgi:hypothetical protein
VLLLYYAHHASRYYSVSSFVQSRSSLSVIKKNSNGKSVIIVSFVGNSYPMTPMLFKKECSESAAVAVAVS